MYRLQVCKNILILQNSTKNINVSNEEHDQQNYQQEEVGNYDINLPELTLYLSPLGVVILWTIVLIILQRFRNNHDNKNCVKNDIYHKLPCKKCLFFTNNHYLKCAVNPKIVLTEEAINCCEFAPKKEKFTDKIRQSLWK
ncbi:hypothetical protein H6F32_06850 [Anabaena sp. FACHB-1237]|uniref:hypothetical protein n=1 Tax=Anabaena sp. FACHB-1237 TaxID=2692769 RepID=UPI0016807A9B|nr:hypothetical protein [Anabaena sp. FACHB-1237]MBD2137307.1 hypothetical protein [Anabaena sp. FACHB-1237]